MNFYVAFIEKYDKISAFHYGGEKQSIAAPRSRKDKWFHEASHETHKHSIQVDEGGKENVTDALVASFLLHPRTYDLCPSIRLFSFPCSCRNTRQKRKQTEWGTKIRREQS
jgi:hypothetical protein